MVWEFLLIVFKITSWKLSQVINTLKCVLLHCLYFNVKLTSIFLSYENIIYYYYHLWSHQLCIVNPYKIVYNHCHNISPFSTHSIVISYIHPFVHCYIIYTSIVHCHILLNNNHKTSPLSIYIPLVHSHIHYYTVTTSVQYTHYSIICLPSVSLPLLVPTEVVNPMSLILCSSYSDIEQKKSVPKVSLF